MKIKTIKFTPKLAKLIKKGEKTTTIRLFDDKDLSVGDRIELATRDGKDITVFGKAIITEIIKRTIETLREEDFKGHEPVTDPLEHYRVYYGDRVQPNSEVKVIRYVVEEIF